MFTLLFGLATNSQTVLQQQVDSMERVLSTMDKSNDKQIAEAGEFILEHSNSDLQKYQVLGVLS